jgi:hypothetical protein
MLDRINILKTSKAAITEPGNQKKSYKKKQFHTLNHQ